MNNLQLASWFRRSTVWFCFAAAFIAVSFVLGLIAACFVPAAWVVTNKDHYYRESNPHSVIDLADDYEGLLAASPGHPGTRELWHDKRQQLWLDYWVRLGLVESAFGAVVLPADRIFGRRISTGLLLAAGTAGLLFILGFLIAHPGYNPFV